MDPHTNYLYFFDNLNNQQQPTTQYIQLYDQYSHICEASFQNQQISDSKKQQNCEIQSQKKKNISKRNTNTILKIIYSWLKTLAHWQICRQDKSLIDNFKKIRSRLTNFVNIQKIFTFFEVFPTLSLQKFKDTLNQTQTKQILMRKSKKYSISRPQRGQQLIRYTNIFYQAVNDCEDSKARLITLYRNRKYSTSIKLISKFRSELIQKKIRI